MILMMRLNTPEDFVIATGSKHSVQDFVDYSFRMVGLDWKEFVVQDPRFMRPAEVPSLCGDASRARERLGWTPTVSFESLVERMVESELNSI